MNAETRPIRRVAVIGAGEQGRSFALRCAHAGYDTVLEDVMPAKLRDAREEAAASEPESLSHLRFVTTVEDAVREADVAVDFMPDELESKLEIFSLLDRMAPPKTILCTPTLAMSISDLAACTYRADRCVALATGYPGLAKQTVQVVAGAATGPEVTEAVAAWLRQLGFDVDVAAETVAP